MDCRDWRKRKVQAIDTLSIVLSLFIFLEFLNVLLLYKAPGSTKGNAMGVFKAYSKAQADPEVNRSGFAEAPSS